MSKFSATGGPTTEKRRQDELDWEDEQAEEEEDRRNEPRACEAFEVDLAAREFGTCKCGFKKQDHIQGYRAGPRAVAQPAAFSHQQQQQQERRGSVGSQDDASASSASYVVEEPACDAYVIDLSAAEFGTCKCGKKKTAHTKQAIFAKPKTSGGFASLQANADREKDERQREQERDRKRREDEARSRDEFLERERKIMGEHADQYLVTPATAASSEPAVEEEEQEDQPKACDAYELDMSAAKFGTCKCGMAKTQHTREALNAKPQQHASSHRASVTASHDDEEEQQQAAACGAFELDMSAAEFGTCKCGQKKASHSKEALFAKPPPSSASRPVRAAVAAPAPKPVPAPSFSAPPKPVAAAPPAPAAPVPVPVYEEEEPAAVAQGQVLDPPQVYRALFDFEGQEAEDLPFREGDLIDVVEVIDQDWLRGRIGSTIGVFPRDYAEPHQQQAVEEPVYEQAAEEPAYEEPAPVYEEPAYEEPAPAPAPAAAAVASGEFPFSVFAQFDFEADNEGDLALRTGDAVTVLEYVDEQWWRGTTADGREGIFPADFVAKDQPAAAAAGAEEQQQHAAGLGFVIAQFDFQAENEGDLSFNQGDRIEVLEVIDDNWMRGALNGNEGILPLSYVSEVTQ